MRIIDSVPDSHHKMRKLMLVEDGCEFKVMIHALNRKPMCAKEHLTQSAAISVWREACVEHYNQVTHNLEDALCLTARRMEQVTNTISVH